MFFFVISDNKKLTMKIWNKRIIISLIPNRWRILPFLFPSLLFSARQLSGTKIGTRRTILSRRDCCITRHSIFLSRPLTAIIFSLQSIGLVKFHASTESNGRNDTKGIFRASLASIQKRSKLYVQLSCPRNRRLRTCC